MIEKLPITEIISDYEILRKINELVDAVNAIQKEREAERFEIQEWIDILEAVRKSVNIHEKQIDELQMKLEPEKCETRSENVQPDAKSRSENVQDPVCFISTTYPSDNKTTVFLGQKGASVEFNQPLPAGFIITIKEN